MRLIDADALLEESEWVGERATYDNPMPEGEEMVSVESILNAPTIEPEQKWIPCSERLPSESDYYLVTDAYGDMSAIWFAHEKDYYGESEWRETEDEILAWMPLPTPYQEEGDKDGK